MDRKHFEIKPGVYPLRPGTPMGAILVDFRRGRPDAFRTRVDDGVWLSELLPASSRTLDIPEDEFWEAARDAQLRSQVGTEAETVEGYLYPTVYYIPVTISALGVVRQMVDTFEAHWDPKWNARLDTLNLTRSEIVALASIIEGEAPEDVDRSLVSSVYHNRLSNGQRLQADPTVVYALGIRKRLYNVDYGVNSEYNTYRGEWNSARADLPAFHSQHRGCPVSGRNGLLFLRRGRKRPSHVFQNLLRAPCYNQANTQRRLSRVARMVGWGTVRDSPNGTIGSRDWLLLGVRRVGDSVAGIRCRDC